MNKDLDEDDAPGARGTKKNKDGKAEDKTYYYSKNYKRFLEHRSKKIDQFIVNCIGWSHVLRCIEVIEMAMRDLVYKIVPTKVVVRELKTSSGKVLTKDSEYTLVERKKYVTVGKKTQIDYVFELDLKENPADALEETKDDKSEKKAAQKEANAFYLNLDEFSLFKLRSAVFLIQFPLSYTIAIMSVWSKIIPSTPSQQDKYSREEIEQIHQTKHAIRELTNNMLTHLKSLIEYLT
jgi:hypothetical protein